MSSFRRAVKTSDVNNTNSNDIISTPISMLGVKPWINGGGLGLVSCGNKQLDELIGGGIALGTTLAIENDIYSNYGETLLSYNISESISLGHDTLILYPSSDNEDAENFVSNLPYNQNVDPDMTDVVDNKSVDESINHHLQDKKEDEINSGLKIAWQYGKYIKKDVQQQTISGVRYCYSFDLSRKLQTSIKQSNPITICLGGESSNQPYLYPTEVSLTNSKDSAINDCNSDSLTNLLISWNNIVKLFIKSNKAIGKVSRIFLPNLSNLLWNYSENQKKSTIDDNMLIITRFILKLKHQIRGTRSILVISINTQSISDNHCRRLLSIIDTVIAIESFAGHKATIPAEFIDFCAFLVIRKIQQVAVIAPFRSLGTKFGLKRDRRKLHVEPLHLPPEESRSFGTAGADPTPEKIAKAEAIAKLNNNNNINNNNSIGKKIVLGFESEIDVMSIQEKNKNISISSRNNNKPIEYADGERRPLRGLFNKAPVSTDPVPIVMGGRIGGISISRTPPLQPGSACQSGLPGSKPNNLDF
jgi:elongator complex protein 4